MNKALRGFWDFYTESSKNPGVSVFHIVSSLFPQKRRDGANGPWGEDRGG